MSENENKLSVRINKKIGIPEWERFEQLADEKKELWRIFWAISNDKEQIKKEKICSIAYFNQFVMSSLELPMREFITESDEDDCLTLHKDDIETVLSLYIKLIPKSDCEICGNEKSFIDKLEKHYESSYDSLDDIMNR
tara:strand:- start:2072 stop:2485 length:414 start_codon:yes stop_codon:yes gene_type:complete